MTKTKKIRKNNSVIEKNIRGEKVIEIKKLNTLLKFCKENNIRYHTFTRREFAKDTVKKGSVYFLYRGNELRYFSIPHEGNFGYVYSPELPPHRDAYIEAYPVIKQTELEVPELTFQYIRLTPEEIDEYIERGKELEYLCAYQTLTPKQIDKLLEKDERGLLIELYKRQKLSPRQIDTAIEKELFYEYLAIGQNLSEKQRKEIMRKIYRNRNNKNKVLFMGYNTIRILADKFMLEKEEIDIILKGAQKEKEDGPFTRALITVYEKFKLNEEQIIQAVKKGEDLWYLYRYQKLSPYAINLAIKKRRALYNLYKYQKLSQEQKEKVETLIGNYIKEQKMYEKISKKIEKAINKISKIHTCLISE